MVGIIGAVDFVVKRLDFGIFGMGRFARRDPIDSARWVTPQPLQSRPGGRTNSGAAMNRTLLLEIACGALMIFGVPLAAWFVL